MICPVNGLPAEVFQGGLPVRRLLTKREPWFVKS